MDLNRISNFIKTKRKELGMTQEELAEKLFVTEKAVSRWETGRGTPDISLLIPLSKTLKVEVSELLVGKESKRKTNAIEKIIEYNEIQKNSKYHLPFYMIIAFYTLSILSFLVYLRYEYNPNIELNYFSRLFLFITSSIFILIGNRIYCNRYVEKLEDKNKVKKVSQSIIFIYYIVFLFNMVLFARYYRFNGYNLVPFKGIIELISSSDFYSITINIFGNIFIFMPFEYFMVELFGMNKIVLNGVISFLFVLFIEIVQYIFKVGIFDVDDLILCTSGMMLFYFIYRRIKKRGNVSNEKRL